MVRLWSGLSSESFHVSPSGPAPFLFALRRTLQGSLTGSSYTLAFPNWPQYITQRQHLTPLDHKNPPPRSLVCDSFSDASESVDKPFGINSPNLDISYHDDCQLCIREKKEKERRGQMAVYNKYSVLITILIFGCPLFDITPESQI